MPIYNYECQKCGKIQEKFHKIDDPLEEGCEEKECGAGPDELKKQMPCLGRHVSWGSWRVSNDCR